MWPALNKSYYSYFYINEKKKDILDAYNIWNKINSFDMKKRENIRHVIRKVKKKVNLSL